MSSVWCPLYRPTRHALHSFQDAYDERFRRDVYGAPLLSIAQVISGDRPEETVVRVQYSDRISFKTQAKQLGLMDDFKVSAPSEFMPSDL